MTRTLVADLPSHLDETVTVYGWINTLRLQRRMQFVLVRDHTGLVQVTHARGGDGDAIEAAFESIAAESAVKITGKVVGNPQVKLGGLEIVPERVEVVAPPSRSCP
jgi:aspartyl-tRNA synthetase